MRMWNINPEYLCRKHLLGEHVEMHMFIGAIKKGISLKGYTKNKLVETDKIVQRHNELAIEMGNRGFNHKSPINGWECSFAVCKVDVEANLKELSKRCINCRTRIKKPVLGGN